MERAYKIAILGVIISIIALIIIGVSLAFSAARGIFNTDHRFLGIAWASISQISLPIIGKIPLLPNEALYLMAFTDIYAKSNLFLVFNLASIISIIFAVGGIMTGYGFYKLYKEYQSLMSLISAISLVVGFGLIAVIIPLGTFPQTTISPWTYLFYYHFSQIIPLTEFTLGRAVEVSLVVSALTIVVTYILLGTTMIVVREKTPKPELMLSAGILSIIGGILFLGGVGIILIFVAYILLALEFKELQK
ncbi:MAG: hypothetical protein QW279_09995 [Candidatus Jordarchaeaceae archaeon]